MRFSKEQLENRYPLEPGKVIYVTSDGVPFPRGSEEDMERFAKAHAYLFKPMLGVYKIVGKKAPKVSRKKNKE